MTTSQQDAPLIHTPEVTRPIAEEAARIAGLDPTGMTLIRHQTNGVYRLKSAPVVIKVARPGDDELTHVAGLVAWLQKEGVPTVPLWDGLDQPLDVAGRLVTLWRYLPQDRPVRAADLAQPLRVLHDLPLPPVPLPHLDPFGGIKDSIARSQILTDDDRTMLTERCAQLAQDETLLSHASKPGLIHGDAHHSNALVRPGASGAVLSDLDGIAIGPREWDLVTVEVHSRRFQHPPEDYTEFCSRYGGDVREWIGYSWLRDVRELRMITTNAKKSPPGSPAAAEVRRRITNMRIGSATSWTIL